MHPFKNQIGLFANAKASILHTPFLNSLNQEEMLNGYAEMLKHGLIADKKHWEKIVANGPLSIDNQVVMESISIKEFIVSQDLKEYGIRKLLNFGHTIGHAIEGVYLKTKKPIKHGHAVALGILLESQIAVDKGYLNETSRRIIAKEITKHFSIPTDLRDHVMPIFELMRHDKKNSNREVQCVLLSEIGSGIYDISINFDDLKKSFLNLFK